MQWGKWCCRKDACPQATGMYDILWDEPVARAWHRFSPASRRSALIVSCNYGLGGPKKLLLQCAQHALPRCCI